MTAGRLGGDALVRRIGRRRIVVGGALLAAGGLALVTAVAAWPVTLLGYALVGAGCATSCRCSSPPPAVRRRCPPPWRFRP